MTTTPKSIVTSLDWSKKLKEAGWPQAPSCFYWFEHWSMPEDEVGNPIESTLLEVVLLNHSAGSIGRRAWAAPTAEEILRRLPYQIDLGGKYGRIDFGIIREEGYRVSYINDAWLVTPATRYGKSLADAAAQMYCYLAEQKLLPSAA